MVEQFEKVEVRGERCLVARDEIEDIAKLFNVGATEFCMLECEEGYFKGESVLEQENGSSVVSQF